ncbi:hypothetical protein [Halococcus thailandensis]|uniref:hypothetical protein n=1 Tax=Halococcus thailandensis TaxID=335952 RepID=UPI001F4CD357|nr:hypothetical protein [Halococcus thailandensis]
MEQTAEHVGVGLFHRCEQIGKGFRICSESSLRRLFTEITLVSVGHLAVAVVVALQAREDDIDPVAKHARPAVASLLMHIAE